MQAGLDNVIDRALESSKITGVVMLVHRKRCSDRTFRISV